MMPELTYLVTYYDGNQYCVVKVHAVSMEQVLADLKDRGIDLDDVNSIIEHTSSIDADKYRAWLEGKVIDL